MKVSLCAQIKWLEAQVLFMEHSLIYAVKEERMTVASANAKMNAAKAALATLKQISILTNPKEPTHV